MLHSRSIQRSLALVAAVAALGLTACSSDSGYGSSSPSTAGSGATSGSTAGSGGPTISGFAFSIPDSVTAGTPFTVTNADGTNHTFTNPDGAFDVAVPAGGSAEVTIATPGTYTVVCKIHSSMKASITVK